MTEELRDALGGRDELAAFRDNVFGELGTETQILEEQRSTRDGIAVYRRLARWSGGRPPGEHHLGFRRAFADCPSDQRFA
jgi:hypothetical protein